ncbi:SRPBCC family protein [Aeromicrobium sp. 179-A 4D2 NHS]|uniref:SRPBCC family protein n=1 Tax=Aeromicrobium sp. 179-A 4D2 NHS TaxID=3142375 RepID=UPI00399FB609
MPSLTLMTRIAAPVAACFELSLTVEAHTASMGDSGEQAIGGVTTGVMGPGDRVTWRARHFGVPFTMTSAITEYDSPHRFVDEQVRGPFRSWRHEHVFAPVPDGTLMTDRVEFASPAGPIGRLVNRLVLTRYMTGLLEERNAWLRAELERS